MLPAAKPFWKDAFKVGAGEALTPEEEAWLDGLARAVISRGLKEPAMLFLESSKPLNFLASQGARFLDPLSSMAVPELQLDRLAEVLEKRSAIERLIALLEKHG